MRNDNDISSCFCAAQFLIDVKGAVVQTVDLKISINYNYNHMIYVKSLKVCFQVTYDTMTSAWSECFQFVTYFLTTTQNLKLLPINNLGFMSIIS